MPHWMRKILHILIALPLLLMVGYICYLNFGWIPRNEAARIAYLNSHFPLDEEIIVDIEPDGVSSGAGNRGTVRFVVVTDTGARWLYKADVVYRVLPWQIGPAYRIKNVETFLVSDPPAHTGG